MHMHANESLALCEEKCTMTCVCGAVFEVIAARQERFEHIESYPCPVCAMLHTTITCLPPKLSLIIAPAAKSATANRPAA
jgi:hypothetical protein